jgi:hypothetical protein
VTEHGGRRRFRARSRLASPVRSLPLLLALLAAAAAAQPRYGLVADWPLTAEAGAENVLAVHRATVALEDRYLPARLFGEHTAGRKAAGMGYRAARLVLLDHPLDYLGFLVQHEVFGHGARFREFGWEQAGYRLTLPPPYADGSGSASFIVPEGGRTRDEVIAAAMHGAHASAVLARRVERNALERGALHYREAVLYLLAGSDLLHYVLTAEEQPFGPGGNDVLNWLDDLNRKADFDGVERALTLDAVQSQALVGFLDPMLWVGAYAVLKTFLFDGETMLPLPMMRLGEVGYLPAMRFGWGPFGTEVILDQTFSFDGRVFRLALRRTDPTLYAAWGAEFGAANVLRRGPLALDARLALWDQPPLRLDPADRNPDGSLRVTGEGLGAAASATAFLDLPLGGLRSGLVLELGYKTVGFVGGERLGAGAIARLGVTLAE